MFKKVMSWLCIGIFVLSLTGCGSKKDIDLTKNFSIHYRELDRAFYFLLNDHKPEFYSLSSNFNEYWDEYDATDEANAAFFQSLEFKYCDENDNEISDNYYVDDFEHDLENGDIVKVKVKYNETYAEKAGFNVTNAEREFVLDGLPE